MILHVKPTQLLKGSLRLPASKSYSIRSFMIAACGGNSLICYPSDCDDAKIAIQVAKNLGAKVSYSGGGVWKVDATKATTPKGSKINVGESGTVLRFVLPLLARFDKTFTVVGKGTLRGRPNAFLNATLRARGVKVKGIGKNEGIPISIHGGNFLPGKINIDGSMSSQFVSALLIACPLLREKSVLTITGKNPVSMDYITMTLQLLEKAGVSVKQTTKTRYKIPGSQKFRGLQKFTVPSDYGLAAFHLVAAALLKSNVNLLGYFNDEYVQADGHILNILEKMGVKFTRTSKSLKVKGPFKIKGGKFSLKDCPDLVPIVAVLALFANKTTQLVGIKHARVKESDRISDLRNELLKIGAKVVETSDSLTIHPLKNYKENVLLDSHHDHRLAMAFAVLGLKIGVRVKDMQSCSKSYPQFVRDLKLLGVSL